MAWKDAITDKQIRMVYALTTRLGLEVDLMAVGTLDRRGARLLIDALLKTQSLLEKEIMDYATDRQKPERLPTPERIGELVQGFMDQMTIKTN